MNSTCSCAVKSTYCVVPAILYVPIWLAWSHLAANFLFSVNNLDFLSISCLVLWTWDVFGSIWLLLWTILIGILLALRPVSLAGLRRFRLLGLQVRGSCYVVEYDQWLWCLVSSPSVLVWLLAVHYVHISLHNCQDNISFLSCAHEVSMRVCTADVCRHCKQLIG